MRWIEHVQTRTEIATAHSYMIYTWHYTASISRLKNINMEVLINSCTLFWQWAAFATWIHWIKLSQVLPPLYSKCVWKTHLQLVFWIYSLCFNVHYACSLQRSLHANHPLRFYFSGHFWLSFEHREVEKSKQDLHHSGFCSREGTMCFNPADASQMMYKPTRGHRNSLEKNSTETAGTKMSIHVSGGWFCTSAKQF